MEKKFALLLLFLASIFVTQGLAENNPGPEPALQRCKELFNHANTYYWYGRYADNSLAEFNHARTYLDSVFIELEKIVAMDSLDASEVKKIRVEGEQMMATLKIMNILCLKTIGGRVPLFRQISGGTKEYVSGTRSVKKGIEGTLKNTLALPLNLEPLSAHMYFSVVLLEPFNPTYEEIAQQYLNINSRQYIISRYELRKILDDNEFNALEHNMISSIAVWKIMQFFRCNQLGVYSIKLNDKAKGLYYWGAGFDLWKGDSPVVSNGLYAEGFTYDKSGIIPGAIGFTLMFVFFCIFLVSVLAFIFKKQSFIGFFAMSLLAAIIIANAILISSGKIAPESSELFLGPKAILWRIILSLAFVVVPIISCYFAYNRVWKEKIANPTNLFGMVLGCMMAFPAMFIFHSTMFFEDPVTALPVLVFLPLIIPVSYFLGMYTYTLFLGKTKGKDKYYLISIVLFILSLSLLPALIVDQYSFDKSWTSIGASFSLFFIGLILPYVDRIKFKMKTTIENQDTNSPLVTKKDLIAYFSLPDTYIEPSKSLVQITIEKILEPAPPQKIVVNVISGSRGSGKTRLINEVRAEFNRKFNGDVICYFGDCDEFQDGNTIPYEPFVQAMGDEMGEGRFKDEARYSKVIGRGIVKSGVLKMAPALSGLSGIFDSPESSEKQGANVNEITSDILKLFDKKLLGNEKLKIVFILDDIQWMDDTTLELFKTIVIEMSKDDKWSPCFSFLISLRPDEVTNELENLKSFSCLDFLLKKDNKNLFQVNTVIQNEDLTNQNFFSDLLNVNKDRFTFEYLSEKKLQAFFLKRKYVNPIHILQTLVLLIDNNQVAFQKGELKLTDSSGLENLPVQDDLRKIFQIRFEKLDPKILRILISAAFIGQSFEAAILSSIWNMDRLELLYLLKDAEDMNLIRDKSDADDVYEFTSKAIMAELRRYYLKSGSLQKSDDLPQVIKEYHLRIINAYEKLKGAELEKYDLELLCSIAKRTYINRDVLWEKALKFNRLAGQRCHDAGRLSEATVFYNQYLNLAVKYTAPSDEVIQIRLSLLQCYLDMGDAIEEHILDDNLYRDSSNQSLFPGFILLKALYLNRNGLLEQAREQLGKLIGCSLNPEQQFRRDFLDAYSVKIGNDKEVAKHVISNLVLILNSITMIENPSASIVVLKGELLNTLGGLFADKLNDISGLKYLDERLVLYSQQTCIQILSMDERKNTVSDLVVGFQNLNLNDKKGLCFTLNYLGRILFHTNQYPEADFFLNKAFEVNERFGDEMGVVMALSYLGQSALEQGNFENAFEHYRRSYAESNANGNHIGKGYALKGISESLHHWKEKDDSENLKMKIETFKGMVETFLNDLNTPQSKAIGVDGLKDELDKWKTFSGLEILG